MKKYKLIKEYPGSPKLGTILTHEELQYCNWNEYYQEVVEKDYEILSLIEDKFIYLCDKYSKDYIHQLFNTIGVNIHSIKRLSDGEIFTIGDLVGTPSFNFPIQEFKIHNDDNTILSSSYHTKMSSGNYNTRLRDLQKVKQKLFTSEDDVDIFEGDKFWNVGTTYNLNEYQVTNNKYNLVFLKNGSKHFSTKEKAEEYILMNKPCLSLNEIFKDVEEMRKGLKTFENSQLAKRFKKLVKQKLNNKN